MQFHFRENKSKLYSFLIHKETKIPLYRLTTPYWTNSGLKVRGQEKRNSKATSHILSLLILSYQAFKNHSKDMSLFTLYKIF